MVTNMLIQATYKHPVDYTYVDGFIKSLLLQKKSKDNVTLCNSYMAGF